jgi:hypothetical protein
MPGQAVVPPGPVFKLIPEKGYRSKALKNNQRSCKVM